jgi:hypothetical protein
MKDLISLIIFGIIFILSMAWCLMFGGGRRDED